MKSKGVWHLSFQSVFRMKMGQNTATPNRMISSENSTGSKIRQILEVFIDNEQTANLKE